MYFTAKFFKIKAVGTGTSLFKFCKMKKMSKRWENKKHQKIRQFIFSLGSSKFHFSLWCWRCTEKFCKWMELSGKINKKWKFQGKSDEFGNQPENFCFLISDKVFITLISLKNILIYQGARGKKNYFALIEYRYLKLLSKILEFLYQAK